MLAVLLAIAGWIGAAQLRFVAAGTSAPDAAAITAHPTPPMPAPPRTYPPRTFTVLGSGDVLLHSLLWTQAAQDAAAQGVSGYDFRPLFASVKPAVEAADLAVCHLETPLAPAAGPFHDYPSFSVPPQVAPALADLGYDTCSTASNHSLDQGEAGVDRTLDALDAAGLRHAGTARSLIESIVPDILTVRGVKVAQLSYAFGFNGATRPAGREWLANLIDPDAILAAAHQAKRSGAEVVIVSLHWGTEYSHEINSQQESIARRLLASPDVDLILGHHVHVVQPLERIAGKWVAYGMGNEVAFQNQAQDTRDGIMPEFTFTQTGSHAFTVTNVVVRPVHMWLDGRPSRLYDVAAALADPATPAAVRAACAASRQRTVAVLGKRGAYEAGLTVA